MAMKAGPARWRDLILPVSIIASVLVIIVPLPPALLDVLLAANITLSVIIVLTTIYVRTPLEFSVFPSLLLATTLARLVLNVATTRLILTHAALEGSLAAGHVVKAFGEFVAGNQLVVGIIIFVIIVIIQFVVKTVVGMLDWGLDPQQAVSMVDFGAANSPKTNVGGEHPNIDTADNGDHDPLVQGLRKLGHQVDLANQSSGLSAIVRDDAGWVGGADPRREGLVMGDTR